MSDHKARIEELQKEGTTLVNKRNELTQAITQINVRLAEISGALKELDRLAKPEEVKEGEKDNGTNYKSRSNNSNR